MRTERFDELALIEQAIAQDADHGERYAARFILVEGLRPWRDVLSLLERRGVCPIRLSQLCDKDGMPNLGQVMAAVEAALSASDASVALLPLGEVLRLAPALAGPYIARLTRLPAGDRRRVYIPLLDVAGVVVSELDRQDQFAESSPPLWALAGGGESRVSVTPQDYVCIEGNRCQGMRAYLAEWEAGGREHLTCVTELAAMLTGSMGAVSVDLISMPFDVIAACCQDARELDASFGDDEQWRWLAENLLPDESLATACGRILNARRFEPDVMWDAWRRDDLRLRWLAWVWTKIAPLGSDLLADCAAASTSPNELIELLAIAPLRDSGMSDSDLSVRHDALRQTGLTDLPQAFWSALATVDDPEQRLMALPGLGERDRAEIVRSLANALARDLSETTWRPRIEVAYPELGAFLSPPPLNPWLKRYVALASRACVVNEPCDALSALAAGWRGEPLLRSAPDLAKQDATPDETLWVDGLTLQWLGLLSSLLERASLSVQISMSLVPAPALDVTEGRPAAMRIAADENAVWPEALVQQIARVRGILDEIVVRVASHGRLIVSSRTGDPYLEPGPDGTSVTPVIVVSPKCATLPDIVDWDREVKLGVRGDAEIEIVLSAPCAELTLHLGQHALAARRCDANHWRVALTGQRAGRHTGDLVCDLGAIGEIELIFSRGMVENDLGI